MIKTLITAATLALTVGVSAVRAEPGLQYSAGYEPTADLALAKAAFETYLSTWATGSASETGVKSAFTNDAIIELAISTRPEWNIRIDGREAIAEYVSEVSQNAHDWQFTGMHYFPTLQPGIVFVQYEGTATAGIGETVHHRNLVVVEMRGDQIVRIRDFNGAGLLLKSLSGEGAIALSNN